MLRCVLTGFGVSATNTPHLIRAARLPQALQFVAVTPSHPGPAAGAPPRLVYISVSVHPKDVINPPTHIPTLDKNQIP